MGKGEIISDAGAGSYYVKLLFNRAYIDALLVILQTKIADLETKISTMDPGEKKSLLSLEKVACEKRVEYLNEQAPVDPTVAAWCGDLTEGLTGNVGTIEIDGQIDNVNIQPGYDGGAGYNSTRDGQLANTMGMDPAAAFVNFALLPGWQKWSPLYKYATISNIAINDTPPDTCTITMIPHQSDVLSLNTVAQSVYNGIEIHYMDCNGLAFADGATVLVEFTNQDYTTPKVVGFKDNPPPCEHEFVYIKVTASGKTTYSIVWNAMSNGYAVIEKDGSPIQFPCVDSELADWLSATSTTSNGDLYSWAEAKDDTWAPDETPVLSNNTGCGDLYYWSTSDVGAGIKESYLFKVAHGYYGSSWNLTILNNVVGTSCLRVRLDYTLTDDCNTTPNIVEKYLAHKWKTPIGDGAEMLAKLEATITDGTSCLTNWIYEFPDYNFGTGYLYETVEQHAIYSNKVTVQIYVYEWILNEFEADPGVSRTCLDLWCGQDSYACDDCEGEVGDGVAILWGNKANLVIAEQTRQRSCIASVKFYDDATWADPRDEIETPEFSAAISALHAAFYAGNNIADNLVAGTYTIDIRS